MLLSDRLIGHGKQIESLLTDYTTGNISHAYLFYGPEQIGKFTLARDFAKLLQCENDFCGGCSACRQIQSAQHLDTTFLIDDGNSIGIETVRELKATLANTSQSSYKICIIERIERMTREASNSFLKILEEPSLDTIFLLTTDSLQALMPTITSRCRLLRFSLVNDDLITSTPRYNPIICDAVTGDNSMEEIRLGSSEHGYNTTGFSESFNVSTRQ